MLACACLSKGVCVNGLRHCRRVDLDAIPLPFLWLDLRAQLNEEVEKDSRRERVKGREGGRERK